MPAERRAPDAARSRDVSAARAPVALALLGGGLLAGYAVELSIALREGPAELESFLHAFGIVPREVLAGRVGTLGTSIFLHADAFHLLSNVVFLVAFGWELEPRAGPRRFAALFLGCGLVAGLLHVATAPASFVPTVGASGAVSGVLGAWWRLRRDGGAHPRALGRLPGLVLLGLWVAAQVAAALDGGSGQAGFAHLGGFVAGLAAAPRLLPPTVSARTP